MRTGIPEIDNLRATTVVGIDEAGYGAWAGPLYAAAVAVPCTWDGEPDIIDSKRLTHIQRGRVFDRYWRPDLDNIAIGVGIITSEELDEMGAAKAMKLSHRKALESISGRLSCKPFVVVDGIVRPDIDDLADKVLCLPKADARVPVVSLASIVAKVLRDREMEELAKKYPDYGFDKSRGYGTTQHATALRQHGPCPIHRRSYSPVAATIQRSDGGVRLEDFKDLFEDL